MPAISRWWLARATAGGSLDARRELPSLTPLRGIAAMAVLFYHSSFLAYHFGGGAPPGICRRGYLAVDLFFVLSGFVLTHVYGSRLAANRDWPAVGRFLWARFCRIYPAALFTTAVYVVKHVIGQFDMPAGISFKTQLIAALFLFQVPWLDNIIINGPSWSISAEWYAYLLFPFVVPIIGRLKGRAAAATCIALLVVMAIDHTIASQEQQRASGWGALLRAWPEFMVGILAYRFYSEGHFRRVWGRDATFIALLVAIAIACLADAPDGVIVVLLVPLLLASVGNSGKTTGMLNARPLRWLGDISYSVYIFQMTAFAIPVTFAGVLVASGWGGYRFQAITILTAIGCGALVHRCIDVPMRVALRGLFNRVVGLAAFRRRRRAAALPTAPPAVSARDL